MRIVIPKLCSNASTSAAIGPLPAPVDLLRLAVDARSRRRSGPSSPLECVYETELVRAGVREVVLVERREQLVGGQLAAARVGDRLHLLREVDLQPARQLEAVLGLHQVGDAALARLRVDADDRLVAAAEIHRVDRQVRHVPDLRARALLRVHALLDRVLVRAGEGGVDELADLRMARMHGQLVALLDDRLRLVDLRQVEPRVDALRQQVRARS